MQIYAECYPNRCIYFVMKCLFMFVDHFNGIEKFLVLYPPHSSVRNTTINTSTINIRCAKTWLLLDWLYDSFLDWNCPMPPLSGQHWKPIQFHTVIDEQCKYLSMKFALAGVAFCLQFAQLSNHFPLPHCKLDGNLHIYLTYTNLCYF